MARRAICMPLVRTLLLGTLVLAQMVRAGEAAQSTPVLELQRGQSLTAALEFLRGQGLRVVYSDTLVTEGLTVQRDLSDADPEALARAALAPLGLALRELDAGILAVVARTVRPQLRGMVLSDSDGSPVSGARVELLGEDYVAWTDEQGAFQLRGGANRVARLRISASGFAAVEREVAGAGASTPIDVTLTPSQTELDEVTVVASRFAFDSRAQGAFVLDQSALGVQPNRGEDALQAAQRLPGMAFSGLSARPNVRGGDANETLVLLDAMPIREPIHVPDYVGAFSVLDDALIARLTSYSGSLPARYANRLAAVIDMQSLDASASTPDLIGASTYHARVRLAGGAEDARDAGTGWLLTARQGTLRNWLSRAAPDVGKPDTADGFFKLVTRGNGSELAAHALVARSTFAFDDDENASRARLHSNAGYLWASAATVLGDVQLHGLLGYSRIQSRREGNLDTGLTPTGTLDDARIARLWDLQFGARGGTGPLHRWEAGISLASGYGRYDYDGLVSYDEVAQQLFSLPAQRQASRHVSVERDLLGLYLEDRWQLSADTHLELGLRADRALAAGSSAQTRFSPRASLRWSATDATTLRLGWSRAQQFPEAYQLRVEDAETTLPGAQRVDQMVASVEQQFAHGVQLRIEAYKRYTPNPRVRHANLFDALHVLPDLAADRIAIAPLRADARGVELSAQWEHGAWKTWGAYTWSHARERFEGGWIDRDWDQRHTFHLTAAWRQGAWTVGGEAAVQSGRPATGFADQSLASPQLARRAAERYPGQLSLDLRVARRFRFGFGELNVFAQVTNGLDRLNRCCTEIDLPDDGADPDLLEVQAKSGFPLLPALGFSLQF